MNGPSDHPRVIRPGKPSLRIDTSAGQASTEVGFGEIKHASPTSPPKNLLRISQVGSKEHILPAMAHNRPHTGRMVVMKRKIFRKMPSPIRTALMTFRGRTGNEVRNMISKPFDAMKIVDGGQEPLHRHSCPPLSSNPVRPSELQGMNEHSPMMSPPMIAQTPAASELAAAPAAPRPASEVPVLCLQKISPPRLTIRIPELTVTTADGKTINPSAQSHRSIKPPPVSSREALATLNEIHAWKNHAENEHKIHIKLKNKNRELEEEMNKLRAAANQQRAFADHYKMLFERESKKVELLEKKLAAAAEGSKVKELERSSSQRTAESTESWSHSDEAKFHATELPAQSHPSSPVSTNPSLSPTLSALEFDQRIGWLTASQILDGSASDHRSVDGSGEDRSELESTAEINTSAELESPPQIKLAVELESESEPESPADIPPVQVDLSTTTETPPEPTRAPPDPPLTRPARTFPTTSNTGANRISYNHCIGTRIGQRPTAFRVPLSPVHHTASMDWCPSLNMWEWCSVPEVKLRDFVAESVKRRNRISGRVFNGKELMSFKLPAELDAGDKGT